MPSSGHSHPEEGEKGSPNLDSSRSLTANVIAQYGSTLATYAASFLIAPVLLARLGLVGFGVWAVTGSLVQYASVLDFGVTRSLARFSGTFARTRPSSVAELIGLGVATAIALTMVLAMFTVALAPVAAAVVDHAATTKEMRVILLCCVGMLGASVLTRVLAALPTGVEDLVTPALGAAAGAIVNVVISVAVLVIEPSLVNYALASLAAALATMLLTYCFVTARWGTIHMQMPSSDLVREVFVFSLKGQIPWVLDILNFQTDKVVLSVLVDVRVAASYELANRVSAAARQVATAMQAALLPRAVALLASEGRNAAGAFARDFTARAARLGYPIFFGLSAAGAPVLELWLGKVPQHAVLIMAGLNAAYALNAVSGPLGSFALADGSQRLFIWPAVATSAVNLVLTATLGPAIGTVGVLGGTVVAFSFGSVFAFVLFGQHYGLEIASLISRAFAGLGSSLLLGVILIPVALSFGVPATRLAATLQCVVLGVPYCLLLVRMWRMPVQA